MDTDIIIIITINLCFTVGDKKKIFSGVFICKGLNNLKISISWSLRFLGPLGQLQVYQTKRHPLAKNDIILDLIKQTINIYIFFTSLYTGSTELSTISSGNKASSSETLNPNSPSLGADCGRIATWLSISQSPYSIETLTFEVSIGPGPAPALGSSTGETRPEIASPAVWTHRRNGETKTRWIGNPKLFRRSRPVLNARVRPSLYRGGSQGRAAVETQRGAKLSRRWPCLMTTTFWWWFGGPGLIGPLAWAWAVGWLSDGSICGGEREDRMIRVRRKNGLGNNNLVANGKATITF